MYDLLECIGLIAAGVIVDTIRLGMRKGGKQSNGGAIKKGERP